MPRRVDQVDGVVVAVGVEVLRPRGGGGTGVGILREETGGGGVVVAGVHVQQAGDIRHAARERHFVEKRIAAGRRHAVRPGGRQIRLPPGHVVFLSPSCSCQGATRQERRVVRNFLDLPVRVVRIRADLCWGRCACRALVHGRAALKDPER